MTTTDTRFGGYYANIKHWRTTDGHRYVSVPTHVPTVWDREYDEKGRLVYKASDYTIVREKPGYYASYTVRRDGIELPLSFTGLLREAKKYAVRNATGEHVVNVA